MLYPHHPPSLLPLITPLLPRALPVCGTIALNWWPVSPAPGSADELFGSAWATFPPAACSSPPSAPPHSRSRNGETSSSASTTATFSSADAVSPRTGVSSLYATSDTAPPAALDGGGSGSDHDHEGTVDTSTASAPTPPEPWVIIIHLPAPMTYQLRLLTSLDGSGRSGGTATGAPSAGSPSETQIAAPSGNPHSNTRGEASESPARTRIAAPSEAQVEAMQALVQAALGEMVARSPGVEILGALDARWLPGACRLEGTRLRNRCLTFVAPDRWGRDYEEEVRDKAKSGDKKSGDKKSIDEPDSGDKKSGDEAESGDKKSGDKETDRKSARVGLVVDGGRMEDCELIKEHRDSSAPLEYYRTRVPYTTVIRPLARSPSPSASSSPLASQDPSTTTSSSTASTTPAHVLPTSALTTPAAAPPAPPVAWIMTHTYGDMGALFTLPSHRRRGLAKWLVAERLRAMRADGRQTTGWVVVKAGNEASEALWRGMGWNEGWECVWVTLQGKNR